MKCSIFKRCYLCNLRFSKTKTKKHDEHILPNSIGGKLLSNEILCESCGTKLGQSVDFPLFDELKALVALLKTSRDRGKCDNANATVSFLEGYSTSIANVDYTIDRDFAIRPSKPIILVNETDKTAIISSQARKVSDNYEKSNDVRKLIENGYDIIISENIADYIESANLSLDCNTDAIRYGVLKIAIGYSRHCGISRDLIEHMFKDGKIAPKESLNDIVWQYFPTTDEEMLYEIDKHKCEDWYPNHQIYLFNINERLYCYVDLFGVVQKYVLLSDTYKGPAISKKYLQKVEMWDFDKSQWIARSCSDFDILIKQFDLPTKDRSVEQLQEDILNAARKRHYRINEDSQIEKVKTIYERAVSWRFMKLDGHEIFEDMKRKVDLAEEYYGSDLKRTVDDNPFEVLTHIDRDHTRFRMGNTAHNCAEKSRNTDQDLKNNYYKYKGFEISAHIGLANHLALKIKEDEE